MLIDRYMDLLREEAELDLYDEGLKDRVKGAGETLAIKGMYAGDKVKGAFDKDRRAAKRDVRIANKELKKDAKFHDKLGKEMFPGLVKENRKQAAKGIAKKAAIGAGVAAGVGAAAYGGKKLADHIKAKRAAKAQEVAVEEGVSLEEAMMWILECEQDLLNEGYDYFDIYEEDAEYDDYYEYDEEVYEEGLLAKAKDRVDTARINRMYKKDAKFHDKLGKEMFPGLVKENRKKAAKGAAIAAGVGAVGAGAAYALKKHRDKKAKEVAVEEGVSLEEAMSWLLEVEQEYLNEGYDFEDIYGDWE